jgi:flagellum-specific ATP synthase
MFIPVEDIKFLILLPSPYLLRTPVDGAFSKVASVLTLLRRNGESPAEVAGFVEELSTAASFAHTTVVAVPADQSPVLRLRGLHRATAYAEYFRSKGKHVLLMIDSLTRVAHAQRELGLALGEHPTTKGYPPSVISLIGSALERAGLDAQTGGSITGVYTILADGDDVTNDPIVDTARAIADGHIVLSRALSEQNVFPAIDVGKSLSRVMADIADTDHLRAAARFGHRVCVMLLIDAGVDKESATRVIIATVLLI